MALSYETGLLNRIGHSALPDPESERASIYYASYRYLDEWIAWDRQSMRVLAQGALIEPQEAVGELTRVATHYGVARNFKTRADQLRFMDVWKVLQGVSCPADTDRAVTLVDEVFADLEKLYGCKLLSATTKFLWMRFQHPIIIYDSLSWNWIAAHGDGGSMKTYGDFYRVWRKRFLERRDMIGQACRELHAIAHFHRPHSIPLEEVAEALASEWFAERIFDNFICDNN